MNLLLSDFHCLFLWYYNPYYVFSYFQLYGQVTELINLPHSDFHCFCATTVQPVCIFTFPNVHPCDHVKSCFPISIFSMKWAVSIFFLFLLHSARFLPLNLEFNCLLTNKENWISRKHTKLQNIVYLKYVNMFILIFMIKILQQLISAETTCWEIERK